jgi:hypothetical protein
VVYRGPRVLRWLTRLLRPQQSDTQGATSGAALAPQVAVITLPGPDPVLPPASDDAVAVAVVPSPVEPRETCPDCGRTSVFAGPPGHRYCMHCALRQELFDSKTGSV